MKFIAEEIHECDVPDPAHQGLLHPAESNSVRVSARNVSASTVDLAAALLSAQIAKRQVP